MSRSLFSKLPIALALLFCAYAYGLIVSSLGTQNELKAREVARTAAETQHHAAMLANYIAEQRRDLEELAASPEINNYLANRALGMSLRYGLLASQEAIRDLFLRSFSKQEIAGSQAYSRFMFMDADGRSIVDTAPGQPVPQSLGDGAQVRLDIDPNTSVMTISTPVMFKDQQAGVVAVWSDLKAMVAFIVSEMGDGYRPLILDPGGKIVYSSDPAYAAAISERLKELMRLPPGKVAHVLAGADLSRVVVLRDDVPRTGLAMLTVISEDIVYSGIQSDAFLVIAGVLPPFVLFITIFAELLRKRNAKVEEELQSSRRRLLEITDHLIEGIVLVDKNGNIQLLNQSALRLTGCLTTKESMLGRKLDDLFTLVEDEASIGFKQGPWSSVIDGNVILQEGDALFLTASGQRIPMAFGVSPFQDEINGRSAIISFNNIEQLKNAQRELLQSSRLVSVGQLAAGIAHEINTPIQYVSDNLHFLEQAVSAVEPVLTAAKELADRHKDSEEAKRFIDAYDQGDIAYFSEEVPGAIRQSLEGVGQVSRIVLSMKEFSHPGSIGKAMANLNKALDSTITVSRNNWKHYATIETHYDPALPLVYCHLGEMNQVFLNLILNAAQAIEESGKPLPGRIVISTRCEADSVIVEISDSGTGVPIELQDRIFDPFFTTKSVGKGTGQGLAICLDVVTRKHGGKLEVGGAPGQGAIFTITLPIGNDHEQDALA